MSALIFTTRVCREAAPVGAAVNSKKLKSTLIKVDELI